jgi:hypothetical protein
MLPCIGSGRRPVGGEWLIVADIDDLRELALPQTVLVDLGAAESEGQRDGRQTAGTKYVQAIPT